MTLSLARQQIALGRRDTAVQDTDAALVRATRGGPVTNANVEISVAALSISELKAQAYDKRTGEWKARANGGRKTQFEGVSHELHDHHLDDKGNVAHGRRRQESNYFITLNTNKRAFDMQQDPKAMEAALNHAFNTRLYDVLKFGPIHPDTYGQDADHPNAVIESVVTRACIERGPVTAALHAHIYLTIVHWSQIQINVPALQFVFKEKYNQLASKRGRMPERGRPACKVELRPQTDWGQILTSYLQKGMADNLAAAVR